MNNTISLGQQLTHYIIPNESVKTGNIQNENELTNSLKALSSKLIANSIIYVDMGNYYIMYIVDKDHNVKPVKTNI